MKCPICGGDMWDNRPNKASGKFKPNSPDFACKDKACQGRIWPEKKEAPKNDNGTVAPRPYQPRTLPSDQNRLSDKEKAEGMSFGNAKTCASNLLAGAISSNQKTFEEAMNLFEETAQRIYDTDDKTQTTGA